MEHLLWADDLVILSLLWADDLVILSKTEEGLRTALKKLENCCDLNLLKINTTKSKCMIFNSRGRTIKKRFIYKSEALKVVRNYTYLGFNLSISWKINDGLFDLHQRAQKAFYKLKNQMGDMFHENVSLTIRLFDILIKPILLYASDFWGCFEFVTSDKNPIEKLNTLMCKYILGLKNKFQMLQQK